jgi:Mg-chelatase subunit ChlD
MQARRARFLLRLGVALGAAAAIAAALHVFVLAGRSTLPVHVFGREVELLTPRWLLLGALLPYLWLVRGESLSDLSLVQQALALGARALVVLGLALALARPSTIARSSTVATVLLADVSESISDKQLAAAQAFVDQAFAERRGDDSLSVVTFAERPRVVRPVDGHAPRLLRHAGAGAGTDLAAALQLAYGLYPPGTLPRAVILSDGNQTSGDLLAEAYQAHDFGVRVSWKVFAADPHRELRAAALRLPDHLKVGAPFDVSAEVWSTGTAEATLSLQQDDFPNPLDPRKTVTLHEGVNRVSFKSEARAAGVTTYTLRVTPKDPADDENPANNVTVAAAPVKGRPRVLYLEGEYDKDPQVASYLRRALEKENIDVEVRGPRAVPATAKELERYDLVLCSDVAAMFLGVAQMQAIESYVRDAGGGFIMAGGQDSFGSGGYQGTRIEKLLPVRGGGEKELSQPQIAIALVIDRSGSMENGQKLEMAKESARATAEVLDGSDLLTVIAFDSQPTTIVRLQKASNRLRIATDIARLTPGGGTDIRPALQEAYSILAPAAAKVKHVIVLTDGEAPEEGIPELVDEMRANRITVSAVGVGSADRALLAKIAEHGEGKLYMTENAAELPRIFTRETQEVQKSSLVEAAVRAVVAKRAELIEGTGVENAPPLHGYVTTKAKDTAEVILVTERGDPLLARWRVGLGQVVAWTSDVKNRWAVEWLSWPGFPKFFAQLVRTTMRHMEHESYDLGAEIVDGRARVTVDAVDRDDRFVNQLDTTLEVLDPRDPRPRRTLPMAQTAAGRYEAELPIDRFGTFILRAVHRRNGAIVAESVGAVSLPYPAEYLRGTPDEELLRQVGVVTGGRADPRPQDLGDSQGESITYHRELWPFVLLAVCGVFLIDLYLRRVRLLGYRTMKF